MFRTLVCVLILGWVVGVPATQATTYYVDAELGKEEYNGLCPTKVGETCGPKPSIRSAILLATDGDEIVVADGVYVGLQNSNQGFYGASIHLRSANGPANCIIDVGGWLSGFYFHANEGPDAIVDGFTITGGHATNGGGLRCAGASPTFQNCMFIENNANDRGAGVFCSDDGHPTLINCVFRGHYSAVGGTIACDGGSVTLVDCQLAESTTDLHGAAVRVDAGTISLERCLIENNAAAEIGGAAYVASGELVLRNSVLRFNSAGTFGGGVALVGGSATAVNCTMTRNDAQTYGGGVYSDNGAVVLGNCILWDDSPEEIVSVGGSVDVRYTNTAWYVWAGEGNISVDPRFAAPGDYHLSADSPCIDVGTDTPPGGLTGQDVDGRPRVLDGDGDTVALPDMGAHEFDASEPCLAATVGVFNFTAHEEEPAPAPETLTVRNCGGGVLNWAVTSDCAWVLVDPPSGKSFGEADFVTVSIDPTLAMHGHNTCELTVSDVDGLNPPRHLTVNLTLSANLRVPSEFATIQEAIDAALLPADVVLIGDGVYSGPGNKGLDLGGKVLTVRGEHGAENCIIDCENDGRGFLFENGETRASVVESLTVTNASTYAIRCAGASPTIRNCTLTNGASVGLRANDGAPLLLKCRITNNSGGGVTLDESDAEIVDCVIAGNHDGGGIHMFWSSPFIANCRILANSTTGDGGGLHWSYLSDPIVVNCVIAHNRADDGTGIYAGGQGAIVNCTIYGNASTHGYSVAPVYCWSTDVTLANCIVDAFLGIYPYSAYSDEVQVVRCAVYGADYASWNDGSNLDIQVVLADPDGPDDDPNTWEDNDYRTIDPRCVDAGSNENVPLDLVDLDGDGDANEPMPLDLHRVTRFADVASIADTGDGAAPIVDIGAYELGAAMPIVGLSAPWIDFFRAEDDPAQAVQTQTLTIRNDADGVFNWQILAENVPWLTVTPTSGMITDAPAEVTLAVDSSSLAYGAYTTPLVISAPGAINDEITVTVAMHVTREFAVPSQHATIQDAVDATAVDGDVITLADGVYTGVGNKNVELRGRRLIIRSANGAANCVIDCEEDGRAFWIREGEREPTEIRGVTIHNGKTGPGGAILCDGTSASIRDCEFAFNRGSNLSQEAAGGAVCAVGGGVVSVDVCRFESNTATNGSGGAVAVSVGSTLSLRQCEFLDNYAAYAHGGAVAVGDIYFREPPTLVAEDCTFTANAARHSGGAMVCAETGSVTMRRCDFVGNEARGASGGALSVGTFFAEFVDCEFRDNLADRDGGAIHHWADESTGAQLHLERCLIAGNISGFRGGGIRNEGCDIWVENSILARNRTGYGGGGVNGSYCHFDNCTFLKNASLHYGGAHIYSGTGTKVWHCILQGTGYYPLVGGIAVRYSATNFNAPGAGNIIVDPLFVDEDGPDDDLSTWDDNDLRLQPDSPCIDASDPNAVFDVDARDLDGYLRVCDGDQDGFALVDMGAYEFGASIRGDLNCDGLVNFDDVDGFALAVSNPEGYWQRNPDCTREMADIDEDGVVGFTDINPFIDLLLR